jgi:hypothetical protein
MLVPRNVGLVLQQFAEYAFLRDVDDTGNLIGKKVHHLTDAVQRTFTGRDLLAQTSVALFYRPSPQLGIQAKEYTKSNRTCLWGYPLPHCPLCGNGTLNARVTPTGFARVKCLGCKNTTEGPGVSRPSDVVLVDEYQDCEGIDNYCWKDLNGTSPWIEHKWVKNNF